MVGANLNQEETFESDLGVSLGIYGELNDKLLFGIAAETDAFIVAKLGYQF